MATHPISDEQQPDAEPGGAGVEAPSILLYLALAVIAVALIVYAFSLQEKHDWPGLLLNIAAGLIGSVVILIFVDRRLRAQELSALRRLPVSARQAFVTALLPSRRAADRYAKSVLLTVTPLIASKVNLAQFHDLENHARTGFVLVGEAGSGKTTWIQIVAESLARKYIQGVDLGRIPIVFPLSRWLPDRKVDKALYETFNDYSPCSRRLFRRVLATRKVVVLVDAYDRTWLPLHPTMETQVKEMMAKYTNVAWTITVRPDVAAPTYAGSAVQLLAPTDAERAEIKRRQQGAALSDRNPGVKPPLYNPNRLS